MERSGILRKGKRPLRFVGLEASGRSWKLKALKPKPAPTRTRHHNYDSLTEDCLNLLIEHGLVESLPRIAELLRNTAAIIEPGVHIGAKPFERSEEGTGYANGMKERTSHSSLGALSLRVPQTRGCEDDVLPR
jgi:hypothetical protein